MHDRETIIRIISKIKDRIQEIDAERRKLTDDLEYIQRELSLLDKEPKISKPPTPSSNPTSPFIENISLFRQLFKGREDVYPKLWVSKNNEKHGYSPVCNNEWKRGVCRKPAIKCSKCDNRLYAILDDNVIQRHLKGDITIGVYPLLPDDTCHFLAIDFDEHDWQDDITVFIKTCKDNHIPASIERSRSGNGGHVWIFFSEPVPARDARQMGSILITETMNCRYQLVMESYDRLFPNQDTLPRGGFGNLIALPLQKYPMLKQNSVFIDDDFSPYPDQWNYLKNVRKITSHEISTFVKEFTKRNSISLTDKNESEDKAPWEVSMSLQKRHARLSCFVPERITITIANQIYLKKENLPSQLLAEIKRLAAFKNPEFYKKQSMRLSTARIPPIISCAEEIPEYLIIPRGCIDDLLCLLSDNCISYEIQDKRYPQTLMFAFIGKLKIEQEKACRELLKHDTGILVAPPGSGKTVIGISLMAERRTNTLILVHRKPLLEQWFNQIETFLEISSSEIGQIGGGKDKQSNIIDVAMIQTLERKGDVDTRVKDYGYVIVDECHHIPAISFERVIKEANAKYVTGLTATIERRDGHQPIVLMQCGPVRYKMNTRKEEFPLKRNLIVRQTSFTCAVSEKESIHSLWSQLINDEVRNRMIANDVIDALAEGRVPLLLTERIEHMEILRGLFQGFVENIVVMHGSMKQKEKKEMKTRLNNVSKYNKSLIIATGSYIGEGFDVPRLDTLFLTMPISFKGKVVQYAGRLNRQSEGKTDIRIYDYCDINVPVLERMYKKRNKTYISLKFTQR
ncbi:MAG: DEAD/DEAH box helicase family protein [Nitrospirae bacterium]|nr:DEAD/DEAH box helicase family protein [Nitrospirota bacterium]MBF0554075.1 DEAD/DEAH box helicase family protein [Nitrospirota bacterium]